jgi:hypothetical protein
VPELALVQELEQERALRQQELAQAQAQVPAPAPAQLVPVQQHHSQPPRRQ